MRILVMQMIKIVLQFLILTLVGSSMAMSDTVYKSVDENGAISFSDIPPENGDNTEKLQLATPRPNSSGESLANLDAMRDTTDKMAADRREREKHRAEMRELQTSKQSQPASNTDYIGGYFPIITGYDNRRYHNQRPPYRPGLRPSPVHPIARPPMRQRSAGKGSSNSQLMRPITSSRR
ncbi:MAG: hypothetical protein ACJAYC_000331 [Halieaceae bacterium]|jgi:hypothetical protein